MVVGLTAGAPLLLKALLVLVQNVFRVVHGHKGAAETVMPDALVGVVCKSKKNKSIKMSVSVGFLCSRLKRLFSKLSERGLFATQGILHKTLVKSVEKLRISLI